MYSAYLMMVRPVREVPEEIRAFVEFDARRRELTLEEDDKVAIIHVTTTQSYVIVPLEKGLTLEGVLKELSEIDTRLDEASERSLARLLG